VGDGFLYTTRTTKSNNGNQSASVFMRVLPRCVKAQMSGRIKAAAMMSICSPVGSG
jgi:hypothetical protein